jgi:hypothetical protein
MTGKKQQIEPNAARIQTQDFHVTKIKSPRDAASGQATS